MRIWKTIVGAAAVAGVAALLFYLAGPGEKNWIKDARTGCAVWNPNPVLGESVTWLGDCVSGKASGKGVLTFVVNGRFASRYEGEERAGKHHGPGVITFADGKWMKSGFRGGKPHGPGVLILPDGRRIKLLDGKPMQ